MYLCNNIAVEKLTKEKVSLLFRIIGEYVKRHNILFIVYVSIVLIMNMFITMSWYYSPDDVSQLTELMFYLAQGAVFLVSLAALAFLILVRLNKIKPVFLAVANHIYALFLVAWGTVALCFDLSLGFSPLIYLIVATFVAGVFVIDPIFFAICEGLSLIPIVITAINKPEIFFGGKYLGENLILFVLFIFLIVIICFKNYRIIQSAYKIQKKLHELSYLDELTGLLNERSYIDTITDIDRRIDSGEDVNFAVVLMDVNNLKATNDAYGHRYGCSLVVRCGHTIPTIFKTSKMFHIGGDEFLVIVEGDDYEHFDLVMEEFDKAMLYSIVQYEGKDLIFSVARGFHKKQKGQHFKDVLQIADNEMYTHKKYLKEKYNMKGR